MSSSNAGKVDYVKAARELTAKQGYYKVQGAKPTFIFTSSSDNYRRW